MERSHFFSRPVNCCLSSGHLSAAPTVNRAAHPKALPPRIPSLLEEMGIPVSSCPVQSSCGSLVLLAYSLFDLGPFFLPAHSKDSVLFQPQKLRPLGHQQPLYLVQLGSSPDLPWPLPGFTYLLLHRVGYVLSCVFGEGSLSSAEAMVPQTAPSETYRIQAKEGGRLSRLACRKDACLLQRMPY